MGWLPDEEMFDQRPKASDRWSRMHLWQESDINRGNCKCKSWGTDGFSMIEEEKGDDDPEQN